MIWVSDPPRPTFGVHLISEDIDLAIIPAFLGWKEFDLDQAPSRTKRAERRAELEDPAKQPRQFLR